MIPCEIIAHEGVIDAVLVIGDAGRLRWPISSWRANGACPCWHHRSSRGGSAHVLPVSGRAEWNFL